MNGERPAKIQWTPELEKKGLTKEDIDFYNEIIVIVGVQNILELFEAFEPWTADELAAELSEAVERLEEKTGANFGMDKISIAFVTPRELNTHSDEEVQQLKERYGDYIIGHVAGSCSFNEEGYAIEIGMLGMENKVKKSEVAAHLGHELGHTIGGVFLDNPVHEELKAYLFSRIILDEMSIIDVSMEEDPDEVHVSARILREKLSSAGVPGAASIATLIGEPFLGYEPRSIEFDAKNFRVYDLK